MASGCGFQRIRERNRPQTCAEGAGGKRRQGLVTGAGSARRGFRRTADLTRSPPPHANAPWSRPEGAAGGAGIRMTLDVEDVVDGRVHEDEALGAVGRLDPPRLVHCRRGRHLRPVAAQALLMARIQAGLGVSGPVQPPAASACKGRSRPRVPHSSSAAVSTRRVRLRSRHSFFLTRGR